MENMEIPDQKWEDLKARCNSCRECSLCETRTNVVFGKGARDAKILFVGEAPGESEDKEGMPFVGRSGKLLDRFLNAVDFSFDKNIYIANILKCRPPNNRDPKTDEQDLCIKYLREQTRLLEPKIIVCLGRIAAARIIKPDFKITGEHGKWFVRNGVHMTAIYHPSALLRDPSKKADTLLDFKTLYDKAVELGVM